MKIGRKGYVKIIKGDNLKLCGIQAPKEETKAQLTYGNWIINITVKPNLLMRLFLRLLGIKVKILNEGE